VTSGLSLNALFLGVSSIRRGMWKRWLILFERTAERCIRAMECKERRFLFVLHGGPASFGTWNRLFVVVAVVGGLRGVLVEHINV